MKNWNSYSLTNLPAYNRYFTISLIMVRNYTQDFTVINMSKKETVKIPYQVL